MPSGIRQADPHGTYWDAAGHWRRRLQQQHPYNCRAHQAGGAFSFSTLLPDEWQAPVIVTLGEQNGLLVPLIAVHLFVFYFGILADDTPPVGLAAYAAAAIARIVPPVDRLSSQMGSARAPPTACSTPFSSSIYGCPHR